MSGGAIGPGSWVICIDASQKAYPGYGPWRPSDGLTLGALYQIGDCFPYPVTGTPSVSIVGREREPWFGHRLGYGVWRFKAAFDGDEALLRTTTTPVREDA